MCSKYYQNHDFYDIIIIYIDFLAQIYDAFLTFQGVTMFRDQEIIDAISVLKESMISIDNYHDKEFEVINKRIDNLFNCLHDIKRKQDELSDQNRDDLEIKKIVKDAMHEYHQDMIKAEVKKVKKK
jgi:hypothetical protein